MHLSGSATGTDIKSPFTFEIPVSLKAGNNEIALLSMTVGLQVGQSIFFLSYILSYLMNFDLVCS